MTEYLFSERELAAIVAVSLSYFAIGDIVLGGSLLYYAVTLAGGLLACVYAVYQSDTGTGFSESLRELSDSPFGQAYAEFMDRIVLGGVLTIMLALQVLVANEALSQETAEMLASLLTVGGFDIGVFTAVMAVISLYVITPVGAYFSRRAVGSLWDRITAGGESP